jgi:SAM-dependent methyltransferase
MTEFPAMQTRHEFAAAHYAPRAVAYVESSVHSGGADLDQIEALLRGRAFARALDLGCGGGHVSYRAAPLVREVVACDVTPAMLDAVAESAAARGMRNIAVQLAPAESLPFADAWFDAVLSRFSAHHWADMEAGLRQARRVLAPGGLAVFIDTVALDDPALDTHLQAVELLRDASHVRDWSVPEWVAALSRAGFALDGVTLRPLRMDFSAWIARTGASSLHAEAIRSLQEQAPSHVRESLAIGPDGSFDLTVATFVAVPC